MRIHLPGGPVQIEPAQPGETSGDFPRDAGNGPICIVTAHNPHGETRTAGANRRLHRDLLNWLEAEGLTFHPAAGGDRAWLHVEESVAIVGIDVERARKIGRMFAQNAVFVWTPDAWRVVGCEDDTVVTLGWSTPAPSEELVKVDAAYRALGLESPYVLTATANAALDRRLADASADEAHRLNHYYLDLATAQHQLHQARQRARAEQEERRLAEEETARQRAQQERVSFEARLRAERAERVRRGLQAERAQHELDVAAGWPEAWRPKRVRHWVALGGDLAQALAFDEKGWSPSAVLEAAEAVGSATGLVPPAERHTHHEEFGDSLASVLTKEWPTTPGAAVLSLRRRLASGLRERWFVVREGDEFEVVAHVCRRGGSWTSRLVGRWPSLEEAVRGVPSLRDVRPDARTLYRTPWLTVGELAELLRVPRRAATAAELDQLGDDEALGEEAGDEYSWPGVGDLVHVLESAGVTLRGVEAWVNGVALVAALLGRRWRWVTPETWDWEDEAPTGERVAESRWFSESGGAPISWDGGNSLSVIEPGLLFDRQWGDLGAESAFLRWPASVADRARILADWVTRLELELPAALVLEHWPREDQWLEWYAVEISLWFGVEEEALEALRRRLGRNPAYRDARHAVRRPRSALGRKLAVALREATESGFTGDLYGRWLDATV